MNHEESVKFAKSFEFKYIQLKKNVFAYFVSGVLHLILQLSHYAD